MGDPSASESSGTAFQNKSTYLFVPSSFGTATTAVADDTNTPGSYFRLGGYSDLENRTNPTNGNPMPLTPAEQSTFYPRQHITDETAGGADTVVTNAAGKTPTNSGIMLACNGRILVRSAEKIYVHSTGDIHAQTDGKMDLVSKGPTTIKTTDSTSNFDVEAGGEINIRSGSGKDIHIIAGGSSNLATKEELGSLATKAELGNYVVKVGEKKETIAGKEMVHVTKDFAKFMDADSYVRTEGDSVSLTMGAKFSYWGGISLGINTSVDMSVNLSVSIGLNLVSIGITAFGFSHTQVDMKAKIFGADNTLAGIEDRLINVEQSVFDIENSAVRTRSDAVSVGSGAVRSRSNAIDSSMNGLTSV